jgi:hypothetical protein
MCRVLWMCSTTHACGRLSLSCRCRIQVLRDGCSLAVSASRHLGWDHSSTLPFVGSQWTRNARYDYFFRHRPDSFTGYFGRDFWKPCLDARVLSVSPLVEWEETLRSLLSFAKRTTLVRSTIHLTNPRVMSSCAGAQRRPLHLDEARGNIVIVLIALLFLLFFLIASQTCDIGKGNRRQSSLDKFFPIVFAASFSPASLRRINTERFAFVLSSDEPFQASGPASMAPPSLLRSTQYLGCSSTFADVPLLLRFLCLVLVLVLVVIRFCAT